MRLSWVQLRPNPGSKYKERHNPKVAVDGVDFKVVDWSEKAVRMIGPGGQVKYLSKKEYMAMIRKSQSCA